MSESTTHPVEALQQLIRAQLLDVNTAIPATIVTYEDGIATVQPIPKKRFADGDVLDYPIIPNVRVCWPSFNGGKAGCKGPVKPGDMCLLIFSQQAVDDSDDRRMFDLQDAYAVMVDLGRAGAGDSGNNDQMTMFHGPGFIRLSEEGRLHIYAPGGTYIDTPNTEHTGHMVNDKTLLTKDRLTYQNGMTGSGGSAGGGSAVINGDLIHNSGTITSLGKKIDGTHTHSGVQTGGGNTGGPN